MPFDRPKATAVEPNRYRSSPLSYGSVWWMDKVLSTSRGELLSHAMAVAATAQPLTGSYPLKPLSHNSKLHSSSLSLSFSSFDSELFGLYLPSPHFARLTLFHTSATARYGSRPPPPGYRHPRQQRDSDDEKALHISSIRSPNVRSIDEQQNMGSFVRFPLELRPTSLSLNRHRLCKFRIKNHYPQNADFPRPLSKKEKKPFPTPILDLRRAARERAKNRKGQPKGSAPPPKNGLLVRSLIPVAYDVFNARIMLINNLKKLLKVVPVRACGWCDEIHVGPVGHPFKSCKGQNSSIRKGLHEWTNAVVEDIFVPIEAYHLYDRLGKRIPHDQRFSIPRIPAVVELCIQAGVEVPELPTKRRRKPIIRIGRSEFIDADESELPDPVPEPPSKPLLTETPDSEITSPSNEEELLAVAEETLEAWEKVRAGAKKLMRMYPVRVCGYCPEVHVGGSGHKAQNCGAHKHQQRNGQHGWQAAVLDDLIPPRYVWHVPDENEGALKAELRSFYGKAPAVVEMCVQAGGTAPEQYRPTMRLDVGIPRNVREAEMVV